MRRPIVAWLVLALSALGPAAHAAPRGLEVAAGCTGPKKRIGVLEFGVPGKLAAVEGAGFGAAIAAQLATALGETGCFVVAERERLTSLVREQELAESGFGSRETAARMGALAGVQVLITGEVTEFERGERGTGIGVGFSPANLPLALRVRGQARTSHLALDVRLVDAETGVVLQSHRVEAKAHGVGVGGSAATDVTGLSADHFFTRPLGQAAREAVGKAVALVTAGLAGVPWTARVVEVLDGKVYLNAGAGQGVHVGDTLTVAAVRRELIDPSTGLSLGAIEETLGEVRIETIAEKFAVAVPLGEFQPKRGDIVRRPPGQTAEPGAPAAPGEPLAAARPGPPSDLRGAPSPRGR